MQEATIRKIRYRDNLIGIKHEPPKGEVDCWTVKVVCAKGSKKVRGLLTCRKKNIKAAEKRLIRFMLIDR